MPAKTLLLEKYVVEGGYGSRGGEADVYLCRTPEKRRAIAKVYRRAMTPNLEVLEAIRGLDHTNVLEVLDYGWHADRFVEISEHAEGGTLQERATKRLFTEAELMRSVLPGVLNAFNHFHDHRLIHRDIRPDNLFYRDGGQQEIVVGDFGLSARGSESVHASSTIGFSPEYSAPELSPAVGAQQQYFTRAVDYYALGMTLIYLLTGRSPFHGLPWDYVYFRKLSGDIPWPECSEAFQKLLRGLVYPQPQQRWGAEQLDLWLRGLPVQVPSYSDLRRGTLKYTLDGVVATTPEELGTLLYRSFDTALVHLHEKVLIDSLMQQDQDLAVMVRRAVNQSSTPEAALTLIIYTLNPALPYRLDAYGEVSSPEELARLIDRDSDTWAAGRQHLFSGRIPAWLAATPQERRRDAWRREASRYTSPVSRDEGLEVFLHILDPALPLPTIDISPRQVDIGRIRVGEHRTAMLQIRNTGRGHLSGTIAIEPADAGVLVSVTRFEGRGVQVGLSITGAGNELGSRRAEAVITSSAGGERRIPIHYDLRMSAEALRRRYLQVSTALAAIVVALVLVHWLSTAVAEHKAAAQAAAQAAARAATVAAERVRSAEKARLVERSRVEKGIVGEWRSSNGASGSPRTLRIKRSGDTFSADYQTNEGTHRLRGAIQPDNRLKLASNQVGKFVNPLSFWSGDFSQESWIELGSDSSYLVVRFSEARTGRSLQMQRASRAASNLAKSGTSESAGSNGEIRREDASDDPSGSGPTTASSLADDSEPEPAPSQRNTPRVGDFVAWGELDEKPRRLSERPLVYPPDAVQNQVSGTAELELEIDEAGKVTNAKVVSGPVPDYGLNDSCVQAAMAVSYTPGIKGNVPVRTQVRYQLALTPPPLPPTPRPVAPRLSELWIFIQTKSYDHEFRLSVDRQLVWDSVTEGHSTIDKKLQLTPGMHSLDLRTWDKKHGSQLDSEHWDYLAKPGEHHLLNCMVKFWLGSINCTMAHLQRFPKLIRVCLRGVVRGSFETAGMRAGSMGHGEEAAVLDLPEVVSS